MSEENKHSRLDKYEKRRKNTKFMVYLVVIASILVIVLFISILNGGKSDEASKNQELPNTVSTPHKDKDKKDNNRPEPTKANDSNDQDEGDTQDKVDHKNDGQSKDGKDSDGVVTEPVESSDENVANAFTGNWEPVGTEQTGPHTVSYSKGTQDRVEMEKAITLATDIDSMTVWWLERGGDNKVISTVSNNNDHSEVYRVHLEWVDEKGWKPTKVELLKENDQKWRFNK